MSVTTPPVAPPSAPLVPHPAWPIRMTTQPNGTLGLNSVEQDSLDDILACVNVIAACPAGAWIDQPSCGIPSQLFAQAPLDAGTVARAIQRWEPRAQALASEYPDVYDTATRTITVDVSSGQPDQ